MEYTKIPLYKPSKEDNVSVEITDDFISSFDLAPVFILDKDQERPDDDSVVVGFVSNPFFDVDNDCISGDMWVKNSVFQESSEYHRSTISLWEINKDEDGNEIKPYFKVAAVCLRPGKDPKDLEEEQLLEKAKKIVQAMRED